MRNPLLLFRLSVVFLLRLPSRGPLPELDRRMGVAQKLNGE